MTSAKLAAVVLLAALGCSTGSRPVEQQKGRNLLDISTGTVTSNFSLTAFGTGNTPGGQCFVQGYPGGRADSTVAGPLNVTVQVGTPITITFLRTADTYFTNYNYSGFTNETSVNMNSSYGLVSTTFSPSAAGHIANVFSGLVSGSTPISQPSCLISINFLAVSPPSPPSPTSPSAPAGSCRGAVPCYCQNGFCFNNGATLSNSCSPPSGQSCTPTTVNPAEIGIQYAYGYPASVNVCRCTPNSSG